MTHFNGSVTMKTLSLTVYGLSVIAAGILGGCGGGLPAFGTSGSSVAPSRLPPVTKSWMAPGAKQIKRLLYISSSLDNGVPLQVGVSVYDYKTGKQVGILAAFSMAAGQCVDRQGDVWITDDGAYTVDEYAHGGTSAIATLSTNGGAAIGCSIDPTTGNLAVSNIRPGDILIFPHASGTPTSYTYQGCQEIWGPGYDNKGNLYAECLGNSSYGGIIVELSAGGTSLHQVLTNWSLSGDYPGAVMWDGKYLAFAVQNTSGGANIYQAKRVSSGRLKLVRSIQLTADACSVPLVLVDQPFIVGKKNTPANNEEGTVVVSANDVLDGDRGSGECWPFNYWAYPTGGNPIKWITSVNLRPSGGGQSVSIGP
jgi:hypothetical protein